MPFGIDDAILVGGSLLGGILGGNSAKKAAQTAADAQKYAADQTTALQREVLNTAQANTATARATGDAALKQLGGRTGATATTAPTAGAPNWTAYIAEHPDLQAAIANPNGGFNGATPEEKAQDHYQRYGQAAGWALPTYTAEEAAAATPKTDVQLSPAAQVPIYTRPADQAAPAAYTPQTFTPTSYTAKEYTAPTYTAPEYDRPEYDKNLDVSYAAYEASPEALAAQYDIDQQSGAASSALAASGGLKSGAALKALQKIGQDNRVKYYSDFRNYNTNQYNTDRARFDSNYNYDTGLKADLAKAYDTLNSSNRYNYANLNSNNALNYAQLNSGNAQNAAQLNSANALNAANLARSDYQYAQGRADQNFNVDRAYGTDLALGNRAYETSRYDTATNNLFNLANIGQGAAAQTNQAAQNAANTTSNALFSSAAAQGNAALGSAAATNGLIGSGLNALAYYYGQQKKAA